MQDQTALKKDSLDHLTAARDRLQRLRVIYCRMAHERVLIDRASRLPVAGTLPDVEFERVGLCNIAVRQTNPACSHTTARYEIEKALDILESRDEYREWLVEFRDLDNKIHLLDHEKGNAEKRSAQLIKKIRETGSTADIFLVEELCLITEQIAEMEQRHTVYAGKIEKLKNSVLAALNSAIEIEENKLVSPVFGDVLLR